MTAPCDESQSHPSRPTRSSPARSRLPGGQRNGSGGRGGRAANAGVDRSKTPPPHIRKSESILSLPSASAFRHAYACPFPPGDGYRNSLLATPAGLTIARTDGRKEGLTARGFDIGVSQEAFALPRRICRATSTVARNALLIRYVALLHVRI